MEEWLIQNLSPGSMIGLDPKYYGKLEWDALQTVVGNGNLTLSHVNHINLVNEVWTDRPDCPKDPVLELGIEFSGKLMYTKVQEIYYEMESEGAEVLIVTELDEIACKTFALYYHVTILKTFNAMHLFRRAVESQGHRFAISSSF